MVNLLSFINEEHIIIINERKHEAILKQLLEACLMDYPAEKKAEIKKELIGQMKDVNLGKGYCLTHARLDAVDDIHVAIGLLPKKLKYTKGPAVQTIFCILTPHSKSRTYLSFTAHLTRMLSEQGSRKAFSSLDKKKIVAFIKEFEEDS